MTLESAVLLFIAGIFIGTVFTFGMQHWNAEVTREDCKVIETEFRYYEKMEEAVVPKDMKEIFIYCADGKRYSIDVVSLNYKLLDDLSAISEGEKITLLLHPNSDTIVEFSAQNGYILTFEDTISKLENEATGFFCLGIFMYFGALIGLYNIILNIRNKSRKK